MHSVHVSGKVSTTSRPSKRNLDTRWLIVWVWNLHFDGWPAILRKGMQFLFYCCSVDGTIKSLAILTQVGEQHIWGEESKKSLRCWSTVVAEDKCLSLGKPKYLDTQKIGCNHSKIWTMWLYHRVRSPNDADGMANNENPDQTASLGAV